MPLGFCFAPAKRVYTSYNYVALRQLSVIYFIVNSLGLSSRSSFFSHLRVF